LEEYVKSEEFDRECAVQLRKAREHAPVFDDSGDSDYEDSIWSSSSGSTSSSVSSVEPSRRGWKLAATMLKSRWVSSQSLRIS
jgi:hypothetical protein